MRGPPVFAQERSLTAVWSRTLRDQRRALAWWTVGIVAMALMTVAFWPSIRENAADFTRLINNLPASVRDMFGATDVSTPAGYLDARLFSFLGPVLLLVFAIGVGARAIAGEEESGSLDLLLSTPIRRRRVVLDKFIALTAGTALLAGATWGSLMVFGPAFDLHVRFSDLLAAGLNLLLLGLAFGAIALAIGAATGSKGLAAGAASGLAIASFLLKSFAASVSSLEPYRVLSPFFYYSGHEPLRRGFHAVDPIVLAGIASVALLVALSTFERRDLAT
jgi:beta-exotoxin I transport system permease protein